jgi:6-phosphofructokinase 2
MNPVPRSEEDSVASPAPIPPIVTLTLNPCIDQSAAVDQVLPDRKLRCGSPTFEPGGGGVNVARAIRKLGGNALALFPAGGPAGQLLRDLLIAEGVPQRAIPIAGWTRESLNVFESTTGRQFRFVFPGPPITVAEQGNCFAALLAMHPFPYYVVASGSLPPGVSADLLVRVARLVRDRGGRFCLDTSGEVARPVLDEGVFLFKPSLREFQQLTGVGDTDESHLVAECRRWIDAGRCRVVVISLGAGGVLFVADNVAGRLPSPTVPVRSTVGAGDSLLAGIVHCLQQGGSLHEAVRFGIAAGAATVMNPGTKLCRREDAERLFTLITANQAA